ncbi:methyl-CpG-binding domain-containing protein 9 [Typha latifolia]|uniref:methyl-CpG-binding domain-containing protein 9 n=1 Tax=Typha latifolia TaxID=4733 RepID=UPI003C2E5648
MMPPSSRHHVAGEDWLCPECEANGLPTKRWSLGAARLLDINALPPSEGEGDCEELRSNRNGGYNRINYHDESSFSGFVASLTNLDMVHIKNAIDLRKDAARISEATKAGSEDGKQFVSMLDVSQCVGMTSNFSSVDIYSRSDVSGLAQRSLPLRRRKRDFSSISMSTSFTENQDIVRGGNGVDPSSDTEAMECHFTDIRSSSRVASCGMEENGGQGSRHSSVKLPVQYEDFFVISWGEIDLRLTYHDRYQIWPVGFISNWHDKVTGSLFECQVSDGGNSGPVFKVRRIPCSVCAVPNASTILLFNNVSKADTAERTGSSSTIFDASNCKDEDILMLLTDPCQGDQDFFSCFSTDLDGTINESSGQMDMQKMNSSETFGEYFNNKCSTRDKIGEFYVEGRSSSSVWKMVSRTLVDASREAYKQTGYLDFCCRHNNGTISPPSYVEGQKPIDNFGLFSRFCSSIGPVGTLQVIRNDSDLETACQSLAEWLNQDRFGLDMGFVQEIIESLPGSRACSCYQFLCDRSDLSTSLTVASGSLVAVQKNGETRAEEIVPFGLHSCKVPRLQHSTEVQYVGDHRPPPGRLFSSKLSAELAGDAFQIWEFLWRFYDIFGLKDPPTFEDLEEELVDPWPINYKEKQVREIQHSTDQPSQLNGITNGLTSLPNSEADSDTHGEGLFMFVPNETASAREGAQLKLAAHTLGRCNGLTLAKVHSSLLKVLVGELLSKVAIYVDPNVDARESKSRRGRKKDADNTLSTKETKINIPTFNELTWPELARRYVLAVSSISGCMDSSDVCSREGMKLFRCLRGDGGVLCGSLSGVAGMEADALLLAETERQISDSTNQEKEVLLVDNKDSDAVRAPEPAGINGRTLPEWAQPLEPVKKLPTNVGTRIRKCIYDALDKNPPEWAKKILEHSISKEVYKGNASGPTKKAVLSVLAEASGGPLPQKPDKQRKRKTPISFSDAVMKKCRIALRRAVCADESKVFCNLLGTSLLYSNENEDEGILGFPAMVSRPLDFRTIDLRLAVDSYDGSHEAFLEDVREVFRNICVAYGDRPDLMQMVDTLSQSFESLYEEEVLSVIQKFASYAATENPDAEAQRELHDILLTTTEVPKAPWEEGVCKVCGIDKDDDSVLLCDTCDSEYHTYCLDPPLTRIPEGNWYCPSCISGQCIVQDAHQSNLVVKRHQRKHLGEEARAFQEALSQLALTMEEREYWEFSVEERVFLLKFLCDEALNTALIRENLEQCADKSVDLQQKLRSLGVELRNLKFKEELLTMKAAKEPTKKFSGLGDLLKEEVITVCTSHGRLVDHEHFNNNVNYGRVILENPLHRASMTLEDSIEDIEQSNGCMNLNQLPEGMNSRVTNGETPLTISGDKNVSCSIAAPCNPSPSMTFASENKLIGQNEQLQVDTAHEINNETNRETPHGAAEHGDLQMRVLGINNSKCCSSDTTSMVSVHRNAPANSTDILCGSYQSSDSATRTDVEKTASSMRIVSGISISDGEVFDSNNDMLPQCNTHPSFIGSDSGSGNFEMDSLKNEISQLQNSIASLESQLMVSSLRREYLGRDSSGRLYWVIGRPGKRPWLVADGSVPQERDKDIVMGYHISNSSGNLASSCSIPRRNIFPNGSDAYGQSTFGLNKWSSSMFSLYESDNEIQHLLGWLKDSDPRERELKDSILQWQRLLFHQENQSFDVPQLSFKCSISEKYEPPHILTTKAAVILENKFGPCLELEVNELPKRRGKKAKVCYEERMYRCECLEPVWPSRHHCLSCHQTLFAPKELEGHNDGRCTQGNPASSEGKESDDPMKGKPTKSESIKEKDNFDEIDATDTYKNRKLDISPRLVRLSRKACPYDLQEVSKRFIVRGTNKELVQEIGLIGSNGVPSFVPSAVFFLDPLVILNQTENTDMVLNSWLASFDESPLMSSTKEMNCSRQLAKSAQNSLVNFGGGVSLDISSGEEASSVADKITASAVSPSCTIPESSLRPLLGRASQILKRLKIILLDMDAALPEEALRPSKSLLMKRCAWRAFVKAAESIFEMVQATILLEGMIKAEYLRNGWWYWSSLTAAAKTPTVSSLALRIYTLDDFIIYNKDSLPSSDQADSLKTTNKQGKKRKDPEVAS